MNKKLLVSLLAASATLASAQTKKALSIEPFDYSTVMTGVQAIFRHAAEHRHRASPPC